MFNQCRGAVDVSFAHSGVRTPCVPGAALLAEVSRTRRRHYSTRYLWWVHITSQCDKLRWSTIRRGCGTEDSA